MIIDDGFKMIAGVGSPVVDQVAHVSDEFLDTVEGDKGGMVLADAQTIDDLLHNSQETCLIIQ